jgi:hypothetical protein
MLIVKNVLLVSFLHLRLEKAVYRAPAICFFTAGVAGNKKADNTLWREVFGVKSLYSDV